MNIERIEKKLIEAGLNEATAKGVDLGRAAESERLGYNDLDIERSRRADSKNFPVMVTELIIAERSSIFKPRKKREGPRRKSRKRRVDDHLSEKTELKSRPETQMGVNINRAARRSVIRPTGRKEDPKYFWDYAKKVLKAAGDADKKGHGKRMPLVKAAGDVDKKADLAQDQKRAEKLEAIGKLRGDLGNLHIGFHLLICVLSKQEVKNNDSDLKNLIEEIKDKIVRSSKNNLPFEFTNQNAIQNTQLDEIENVLKAIETDVSELKKSMNQKNKAHILKRISQIIKGAKDSLMKTRKLVINQH